MGWPSVTCPDKGHPKSPAQEKGIDDVENVDKVDNVSNIYKKSIDGFPSKSTRTDISGLAKKQRIGAHLFKNSILLIYLLYIYIYIYKYIFIHIYVYMYYNYPTYATRRYSMSAR